MMTCTNTSTTDVSTTGVTTGVSSVAAAAALVDFRDGFYRAWDGWADTAFELCEALLCAPGPVASMPGLSLDPVFRRSHGSLYKCLREGWLDSEAMRDLQVRHLPAEAPLVFAVDESVWPRAAAQTSPERGFYYTASRHTGGHPVVAGWSYQWIAALSWARDSWTTPMDVARVPPGADPVEVTASQLRDLTGRLRKQGHTQTPVFVFDAGYDAIALTHELANLDACLVVRVRDDRVVYTEPAEPTGIAGRPRRHGERRACAEPDTWPAPDIELHDHDDRYGTVHVTAWHHLHPQLYCRGRWADLDRPPIVTGTMVRVEVEHPPRPWSQAAKPLWLWVGGPTSPDIDLCWRGYLHRFDIEHTFRFFKHGLGWTTPRICTPDQADRWTWLIIAAYTQLCLARDLTTDQRLPWETRHTPAHHLSPTGVCPSRRIVALNGRFLPGGKGHYGKVSHIHC